MQKWRGKRLTPLRRRPNVYGGRGEGWITEHGYRVFHYPDNPMAQANGGVPEHRLVMSHHLGRPLRPDETVHHKNGNRLDNRIENLELWASQHSRGQAIHDLVADASAILQTYAPHLLA